MGPQQYWKILLFGTGVCFLLALYLIITFPSTEFTEILLKDPKRDKFHKSASHGNDVNFDAEIYTAQKDYITRRQHIRKVCAQYGIGGDINKSIEDQQPKIKHPPTPQYSVFYIDKLYILHSNLMIVRHPFERLLSAYRDKLENINIGKLHGVEHFYHSYGKKIVSKYRKQNYTTPVPFDKNIPPQGIEPTFEEFVRYLVDIDLANYADDHWLPYYLHCTPCMVDYDVIAKFETLERDQKYIIHKLKLESILKQPKWKHMTKGIQSSRVIPHYFSQLSKELTLKLYEKYELDFKLFDYDTTDYLHFIKI